MGLKQLFPVPVLCSRADLLTATVMPTNTTAANISTTIVTNTSNKIIANMTTTAPMRSDFTPIPTKKTLPFPATASTFSVRIIQEVRLTLRGDFNEVVDKGEKNKQKFLVACTRKISNDYTRDLECTDVRPGSIIVDIEGEPERLKDVVQELKTAESFKLEGYVAMVIENVDVIPLPTTKKTEDIWSAIIDYLFDNGSVYVFAHSYTSEGAV